MNDPEQKASEIDGASAAPPVGAETAPAAPDAAGESARRRRRRSSGWAVALTLLGAAVGAALGWTSKEVQYQCVGLIYIESSIPSRHDPDGVVVPPRFEQRVQALVQALRQRRLTNMAIATDIWKSAQQPGIETSPDDFEEQRTIVYTRRSQHVQVQFVDPDPRVALAGVHAIVETFVRLAPELTSRDQRLVRARARVEALTDELEELKERLEEQLLGEGWLRVLDKGQLPTEPFQDRRLRCGATWAGFGALPGFLFLLLLGLVPPRTKRGEGPSGA